MYINGVYNAKTNTKNKNIAFFSPLGSVLGLFKRVADDHSGRVNANDQLQETRPVHEQHSNGGRTVFGKPVEPRRAGAEQQFHYGHRENQSEHAVLQQQEHQSSKPVQQSVHRPGP